MTGDAGACSAPGVHVGRAGGGLEPARTFILRALAAGKHVVPPTRRCSPPRAELYEEARRRGVTLALRRGAAASLIRAVKEGLPPTTARAGRHRQRDCNYICRR